MGKIALISCTKLKQEFPCSAREMYMKSTLFSKIALYIEQQDYSEWYILSAKYGLLFKDTSIEPYDVTLNNMNVSDRKAWALRTAQEIVDLGANHVDFYAGRRYREYIIPILKGKKMAVGVPLIGLGIGEQLRYLTTHTAIRDS
ncbi:DUF6884 domain-containing protein [Paenibacillus cremeus]|uniref:DUF6884 domain-containing protein n=1 Tax=Paenibacillus cremeus TaxID=2163881 RepID=A0A559JHP5_9BACL|nr:DUF6884 domain-containing protein [Paenibacillus cremeus]TVX99402.1 hypothetical protein FPZ49_33900 [Paenibacillus cremeus]